jgi:aspartate carbamoyltransferase catalytic subunit
MQLLPVMEGLHSAEAFNPAFLEAFFLRARQVEMRPLEFSEALRGQVIATVFAEPSTRTRLSFESAAHRLGASVITMADPKTSSGAKGETLADMAKVIGSYCDLMVLRHPQDGASRLASLHAGVPVVNGGDGRLGHPTQTLVDLYTLFRKWGSFEGRTIGLMGDLRNGRTARSLAWGLAMLGARILLLPGRGLDWEASFERRILDKFDYRLRWGKHPLFATWTGNHEARVLEPKGLVQKSLFREDPPEIDHLDALYLTRMQAERGATMDSSGAYPGVTLEHIKNPLLESCLLLHPLPRCEELPEEIDSDPRALYFEQAAMGPIVRQVVFLAMLGEDKWPLPPLASLPAGNYEHDLGLCPNEDCVTRKEKIQAPWRVVGVARRSFLCAFCDSLLPVDYAGCRSTQRVHPVHSQAALRISPENLRPFLRRDAATDAGYTWGG